MKNLYLPFRAKVTTVKELSSDTKLFRIKKIKGKFKKDKEGLVFIPGQFILANVFGYGEAPFGISSSAAEDSYIEIIVRSVGAVTEALHRFRENEELFLRGPLGNGFPIRFIEGKDVVMVTGGCGIPPIAALTKYIIENRDRFGRVYLIYGARTAADLLLNKELNNWKDDINVLLTVDKSTPSWRGRVGLVTELLADIRIDPKNAVVAMCGPWPMMRAVEQRVKPMGISDRRIFVNMERKMQCGIGRCQHCVTGDKYVCHDGPVFKFDEVSKNWD